MVLYGITGTLFAYCVSLVLTNSLAAFAVLAAYQDPASVQDIDHYSDPHLPDSPQQSLEGQSDFRTAHLPRQQFDCERVEGLDVLVECLFGEVDVAFHDIDNHGAPRDDVALLRFFIEGDVIADDIGAKTGNRVLVLPRASGEGTYGTSAASVSARLAFLSSPSS